MIQVFDNLLSPEDEDIILRETLSQKYVGVDNISPLKERITDTNSLPVLYQEALPGDGIKGPLQKYLKLILSVTKINSNINFGQAQRWKINKLSPTEDKSIDKWGLHVDQYEPHYSIIYYINDSDGDTVFYNDTLGDKFPNWMTLLGKDKDLSYWSELKRVSPKKGRIVIFDGRIFHRSSYPTTQDRYILNYNVEYKATEGKII